MAAQDLDLATLDALGAWVIVLDLQGRVAHANPALVEATGLEKEKWVGRPVAEVFELAEDSKAVQQVLADVAAGSFPNSYQLAFRTADGRLVHATWANSAVRDERGEIVAIIGTAVGGDSEGEPTELLLESEDRFQALARNASELISEMDERGRIVFVSPNHEAILGYAPAQLLGREAMEWLHPDHRARALGLVEGVRSEGTASQEELRYRHADGSWRWFEASVTTYRTRAGSLRVISVSRDVTERHLLQEAKISFGRILEESLNEIYVFDAETLHFAQVNRGARENLGYSMRELRELTPLDLKPEVSTEDFHELIEPLRSGRAARVEFSTVLVRKDGSRYPVEVHLQRAMLDDAPVFVAIILDLTERWRAVEDLRKTEQRARDAEQLASIGTLAAGLAHDIGTPMNVILGYAEMLRRSATHEQDRERARVIGEQVRRITALIQTLLKVARPEQATRVPIDVASILEESLDFYRERLHRGGIEVERHLEEVPAILGDPHRLEQVFLNLLANSVDAMPDGGSLTVHLDRLGDRNVEVRVRDTGAGIAEEDRLRIFEPFFTTKERGKGTGLGLLVSKGIIVDMGGTIDVASEVGKGTEFRIGLPIAGAPGAAREPAL